MNWLLIKLVALFVIFSVALKCKIKLTWALLLTILATVLMYGISLPECWMLLQTSTLSYETFSVVAVLYVVTILQLLMEKTDQLRKAQRNLDAIFNNRRINATLAPVFIGLLPAAATAKICGDIVREASADALSKEEQAFVTSYFRHIPEGFLPTYISIVMMSQMGNVEMSAFVIRMMPLVVVLIALGYVFYVRKIPAETGLPPCENKGQQAVELVRHLWSLIAIIILILAFHVDVLVAVTLITLAFFFVHKIGVRDAMETIRKAVQPHILMSTYLVMVFKGYLDHTGAIEALPEALSVLPIPPYLVFALIFFFSTVVSGSKATVAMCTTMAFSSIQADPAATMVLLMGMAYAAMQLSPTHVCIFIVADHFGVSFGDIVKKTIPVVVCFCAITIGYFLLLA